MGPIFYLCTKLVLPVSWVYIHVVPKCTEIWSPARGSTYTYSQMIDDKKSPVLGQSCTFMYVVNAKWRIGCREGLKMRLNYPCNFPHMCLVSLCMFQLIPSVESVVFCKMAPLQLTLYQHLLRSGLVQACLRRTSNFSPHLVCIGALKKLCNCPSLIHSASAEVKEGQGGSENIDEVRVCEVVRMLSVWT